VNIAVVISGIVPSPDASGSALTAWTIVRYLLEQGHTVGVVLLLAESHDDPGTAVEQRVADLRALGIEVRHIRSRSAEVYEGMSADLRSRLRRIWQPRDEELFPTSVDASAVSDAVEELAPDVAYVYHWDALAATRPLGRRIPRLATVVDLPQLSLLYRWRSAPSKLGRTGLAQLLWLQGRLRRQPRLLVELLNECEASANFAAHHAEWLRERGAAGCAYLRTPVEDRPGSGWRSTREGRPDRDRPRLLLIGHLRGISTQDGLDLFAHSVLPRLEEALGPEGFEARLAGGYDAPANLRAALDRPAVRFLGHLRHPDEEFAAADALVVPTSIPLGTRVRILSAFSFGCPVVAHESNAQGIPELAHGENVLLGRTGQELADGFLRVARDRNLRRRLEERGRETYERFFAPPIAAAAVEAILERIAVTRRRPSDPASVVA
jgi:glycosyltransferase involved in cell wall biosynthesis